MKLVSLAFLVALGGVAFAQPGVTRPATPAPPSPGTPPPNPVPSPVLPQPVDQIELSELAVLLTVIVWIHAQLAP